MSRMTRALRAGDVVRCECGSCGRAEGMIYEITNSPVGDGRCAKLYGHASSLFPIEQLILVIEDPDEPCEIPL